jgi:regulator of protease activity HflC (stomatin/prohibitin superfamily)
VNKAIQDMNRLINEGKEAYNKEIPRAQGDADRLVQVAQGYAAERVNKARGDVPGSTRSTRNTGRPRRHPPTPLLRDDRGSVQGR